ncbi:DNA-3-methyladenine glycosylase family protein [Gracilibacillus dipsosauri]|uniref:DNA-3-methyladenine glycosylase II n=1 Tax=Gracilibacillus dipsosauri TaxID=178340 RepID=A0A317KVZ6_9BACI|nr:DNA-3-methyladenine glycosylase [Gracilibacillus dipsosauri]PWU66860.1 DNA-3-methyladenine glycosylase [Gracilibacillus dipsosauri]
MWKEQIDLTSSYDFDYILMRLAMDPLNNINKLERRITIPLRVKNKNTLVKVTSLGTTEKPSFLLEGSQEEQKATVLEQVKKIFAWDEDLQAIQKFFEQTDLKQLFKKYPYTPLVKEFDLFSNLMKTIIHQQLNMSFAQTLTERFVKTYGEKVEDTWFYPEPDKVAVIPYEKLQAMQFSRRKAEYVIDTAKQVVQGHINLSTFETKNDEEVISTLTKLRGIGPWTAQNWLMFSLGRKDLFPVADIGVQNALKKYYDLEKKPTRDRMQGWSEKWKPYRSYATMTLWRSIEER